jgi:hypothetical protein
MVEPNSRGPMESAFEKHSSQESRTELRSIFLIRYFSINRAHLESIQKELMERNLPASSVAKVLGLPDEFLACRKDSDHEDAPF